MKIIAIILFSGFGFLSTYFQAPTWKKEQLMSTVDLNTKIKTNAKDKPLIFNVGPMENIKGAIAIGAATNVTFGSKITSYLTMESKTKPIVLA